MGYRFNFAAIAAIEMGLRTGTLSSSRLFLESTVDFRVGKMVVVLQNEVAVGVERRVIQESTLECRFHGRVFKYLLASYGGKSSCRLSNACGWNGVTSLRKNQLIKILFNAIRYQPTHQDWSAHERGRRLRFNFHTRHYALIDMWCVTGCVLLLLSPPWGGSRQWKHGPWWRSWYGIESIIHITGNNNNNNNNLVWWHCHRDAPYKM